MRLLSERCAGTGLLLATAFALGLVIGTSVSPVTAGRRAVDAVVAAATPRERATARPAHPAEVLRVFDGDTFEARIHPWPGLAITTRVRLRGIDTAELKARCAEERAQAEAARTALDRILAEGDVGIAHVTLDKYGGRVLADASTRLTSNVAAALIESGIARPYSGGRRESWC